LSATAQPAGPRGASLAVVAAFAAVYGVWGSTYLAIAWAVRAIPPFMMIGVRCLAAGTLLYVWARARGGPRPSSADWRGAAVAGALLFVAGQAVLAWAETRIPSGPAAVLVATEPMFIVLLGWRGGRLTATRGRGSRPSARTLAALAAGFTGVALLVLPAGGAHLDVEGAVAALVASLAWSVGVFRARPRRGLPGGQYAGMQLLAGGGALTCFSFATGEIPRLGELIPQARSLLCLGYLIVFGSVVTYAAYVWLLERVGPERVSTHAYVNPLVAVVLGAIVAGEPVTPPLVAAMVVILGAVCVLVRRPRALTGRADAA